MNMRLAKGILYILRSLHFDAKRREADTLQVFDRINLRHHFHMLDILGTVGLWLIILRENWGSFRMLAKLGEAVRIFYNLRDLAEDMRANLCNIPAEDMRRFSIYVPDISSSKALDEWLNSEPVRAWRAEEARRGMRLFRSYTDIKRHLGLHAFTRTILSFMFETSVRVGLVRATSNAPA